MKTRTLKVNSSGESQKFGRVYLYQDKMRPENGVILAYAETGEPTRNDGQYERYATWDDAAREHGFTAVKFL